MQHYIDPTVDFVFKALFGTVGNENLLVDFLNRTIQPEQPITSVTYLNPTTERAYSEDKLSVVDVKAEDSQGYVYQVEVQLSVPSFLCHRMLYSWTGIYKQQIVRGDSFDKLKPVIAIWLLTDKMAGSNGDFHHHYQLWDQKHDHVLTEHLSIHVIELANWCKNSGLQEEWIWLYFLKEGKRWLSLPDELNQYDVMRQAMGTLRHISETEKEYWRYLSYEDRLMVEASEALEKTRMAEEKARMAKEKALAQSQLAETKSKLDVTESKLDATESKLQGAEAEIARLKAELAKRT